VQVPSVGQMPTSTFSQATNGRFISQVEPH
jgi:hypothetical protein